MKRVFLIQVILLIPAFYLAAQKIDSALNVLATQYPAEKIYIQYDKNYYIAGETIWFKAYLYSNGAPSGLSNNFYLQLTDAKGNMISTKKYPVKGATVKGDIDLPDSIPQGYYTIRALTPGMFNADRNFQYAKDLFVFNTSSKTKNPIPQAPALPLSVQFFPESGNLVNDILAVVAFKALDLSGNPVEINGFIKTEEGTMITSFSSFHDGIGKVQFKPQAGKKYLAAIEREGQTVFYSLPVVQATGVSLRVENEKSGKMFLLSRSKKEKEDFDNCRLVATMNDRIVYDNEISFEDYYSVKGHLITDSLPSGILHFTVFNKEGIPLAERLAFIDNKEYETQASLAILKQGTGAREENIVEITFPEIVQRSCSVAVTDLPGPGSPDKENIISSLLLTSDLKGTIINPAYYFRLQNDSTQQALDNLMLTHGWTRFEWKKILAGEFPSKSDEDKYLLTISGSLKDSKTKEPLNGGTLSTFLVSEDSVNHHFEIEVDSHGRFVIDSLLLLGKTKFSYAYTSPQGKEKPVDLYLDPIPADTAIERISFQIIEKKVNSEFGDIIPDESMISKKQLPAVSKLEKTKELAPVVIESKSTKRPIELVNEEYTSGVFTAMGRVNIDNIHEPENDRSISVYEYIRSSIKQVEIQDDNFVNRRNFSLFAAITGARDAQKQKTLDSIMLTKGGAGSAPGSVLYTERDPGKKYIVAIFLNESPTYIGILKTIKMDEVALLKFYEPGFVGAGGADGPGGALSIYTKKESVNDARIEKLDHVIYNGYSLTKEFYSPDYNLPNPKQIITDNRTTLYWNPDVYTNEVTRSVKLHFFNNDFNGKIRIVIEGFDANGKLIHIEKIIGN